MLERLFDVFGYMFDGAPGSLAAFRLVVDHKAGQRNESSFSLWCMAPEVVFSSMARECQSVLLASGTLAPMHSFVSELQVPFEHQIEATHVINTSRQLWFGTIGLDSEGAALNASFKAMSLPMLDAIGRAVRSYCTIVPNGVLCFLPSYSALEKLVQRWKATSTWSAIESSKAIFVEPKQAGQKFDAVMAEYYQSAQGDGALLLCVCRGKASEGLNFADHNARAVLIVGIPYPSVKDPKIDLKRKYNDAAAKSKGLLTGSRWYKLQVHARTHARTHRHFVLLIRLSAVVSAIVMTTALLCSSTSGVYIDTLSVDTHAMRMHKRLRFPEAHTYSCTVPHKTPCAHARMHLYT